mmetsp:Transcript_11768/g.14915  ORF Transcript_11768/g.14915 Transcript_11768/m.14915 type:complete len:93 (-) Transcript_11768:67-345(-)
MRHILELMLPAFSLAHCVKPEQSRRETYRTWQVVEQLIAGCLAPHPLFALLVAQVNGRLLLSVGVRDNHRLFLSADLRQMRPQVDCDPPITA